MKLPSIQRLASAAWATAQRFPVVLLCGVVAAIAAMRAVEADTLDAMRPVAAATLGLPLLTGLTLFAERRNFGSAPTLGAPRAGPRRAPPLLLGLAELE